LFVRILSGIGNVVLVLLLTALPGALLFSFVTPGTYGGFLLGMAILLPFAAAGLILASPFLLLLKVLGHRSQWSRLGLAAVAGAFCGLTLGYMPDSDLSKDAITLFNYRAAAFGALIGAVFGLWGGAWWCFFFRSRALKRPGPQKAAHAR
jgi:hypothetical protein